MASHHKQLHRFANIMTNKQRRDLVAYAKELTRHGKHAAAESVYELLNEGR